MAYIGKSPTGAGVRSRFHFTATGGETSLSGADDNGKTLVFADGEYVDVYLNGVLLFDGDYNTTTANTIGGLDALTASDVVEIVVYDIFSVADTVSAKNGGTFNGDVTVNGDLTVDTDTLYVDSANDHVGIGTTSIATLGSQHKTLQINGRNTSNAGALRLRSTDNSVDSAFWASSTATYLAAISNEPLHLRTNNTDRLVIDTSGNVGINEANPETRLHITDNTANDGPVIQLEGSGQNNANYLLGAINFKNNDTSGDGPTITGGIRHYSSSSAGSGGYFTFHTHDGTEGGEGSDAPERMRIDPTGRILIATTSYQGLGTTISGATMFLNSSDANDTHMSFRRNNTEVGSISRTATTTSYVTSSDHRLKENVEDMTGAITRVKQLQPRRFSWIVENSDSPTVDGFIAHEAQTVVPESVKGTHNEVDDDGNPVYQGIDQAKLVPLLTGALQEAITKIETLETEMTALKARVTALENA